jgi:adenosine deaminase
MTATPADAALRLLSPAQLAFIERLPKAELHAHLNGSIPLPLLQELAQEYLSTPTTAGAGESNTTILAADVLSGLQLLQAGVKLDAIDDFFGLFPAIYALTSTRAALRRATRGVLSHFLDGASRGAVAYLELRTTPRETPGVMTRREYLEAVLDEVETRAPDAAALIVSLDRRMVRAIAQEVLELAVQLRREGRRVVGVDLCGDPRVRSCVLAHHPDSLRVHLKGGRYGRFRRSFPYCARGGAWRYIAHCRGDECLF